jgi:hypothetical protein
MDSPVQSLPENQTAVKKMVIMLLLAFLGSQLNKGGVLMALVAYVGQTIAPRAVMGRTIVVVLAFLLLWASFLALSLYPERRVRNIAVGLVVTFLWGAGILAGDSFIEIFHLGYIRFIDGIFSPLWAIETGIAIGVCLWASGRVKSRAALTGLGLGLLIGAGMYLINLPDLLPTDFSPLWLSMMLFPELLSRRADRRSALVGALLCVGLILLSVIVFHFFHF